MSGISKRVSSSWVSGDYGIMKTATDTLTTLPAIIYPNDTTATVGLKGNMEQNGTPTPQNPIQPSECGDLETTGEHAGQYKIPISSGGVTTNIYLSEPLYKIGDYADTIAADGTVNRVVKRVILQGGEIDYSSGNAPFRLILPTAGQPWDNVNLITWCCSHYRAVANSESWTQYDNLISASKTEISSYGLIALRFRDTSKSTVEDFNTFLSVQYAAGIPVTIWYVLKTPETGIVNEPIRKIGDYADTVSGISIPTIAGANSFDVLTTLKPSEVTANYHGWHTGAVHERENGQWD